MSGLSAVITELCEKYARRKGHDSQEVVKAVQMYWYQLNERLSNPTHSVVWVEGLCRFQTSRYRVQMSILRQKKIIKQAQASRTGQLGYESAESAIRNAEYRITLLTEVLKEIDQYEITTTYERGNGVPETTQEGIE